MTPIPTAVPRMCGAVRRNPNVEPDASSRTLFGPGVTELTIENADQAEERAHRPDRRRPTRRGLVRSCDGAVDVESASVGAWKPSVAGVREALTASLRDARIPAPYPRCLDALPRRRGGGPVRPRPARRAAPSRRWSPCCRRASSTTAGPATAGGYRKRVIYLEPSVIGEDADRAGGRPAGARRPGLAARSRGSTTRWAAPTTRSRPRRASRSSPSAIQQASATRRRAGDPSRTARRPPRAARLPRRARFEPVTSRRGRRPARRQRDPARPCVRRRVRDRAARLRARSPPRGRPRADPRWPAVSRCRRRGRVLRPGAPHAPVQAVPRDDPRPVPGALFRE